MNNMKYQKLRSSIEVQLTEKRMRHTLGVLSEAEALARRWGADVEKAELAALCHDMARCKSLSETEAYAEEFDLNPRYSASVELAHAKIAAELLKRQWNVEDEDVLNAVAYHTTGRPGMSLLEKIIYVADAIEPGRDYPGVHRLRELACRDLDAACLAAMDQTLEYLGRKGCKIEDDTIRARESLLAKERRANE